MSNFAMIERTQKTLDDRAAMLAGPLPGARLPAIGSPHRLRRNAVNTPQDLERPSLKVVDLHGFMATVLPARDRQPRLLHSGLIGQYLTNHPKKKPDKIGPFNAPQRRPRRYVLGGYVTASEV